MPISDITSKLGEIDQPVITDYELGLLLFDVYKRRKVKDIEIVKGYVYELIEVGVITQYRAFPAERVFHIIGKKAFDAGDVVCSIDPFAYISHLSAMAFHGLTDRVPHSVNISTPPYKNWKSFANEKMKKDLNSGLSEYIDLGLPKLAKIKIDKINGKSVVEYASIHQGAFKKIERRRIRVSTVGRTFLDMVREPDYCGGMSHIIDVFREHGIMYKKTIIDNVDRHGRSIEKARVGYLLEEYCDVKDEKLDGWAKQVQRGGSRKLDPKAEFSSEYSEKWCISLNA